MKKRFSKSDVKKPIFPRLSKKHVNAILDDHWYVQVAFYLALPIIYLVAILSRTCLRIAYLWSASYDITYGYTKEDFWGYEIARNTIYKNNNLFELAIIYFFVFNQKVHNWFKMNWNVSQFYVEKESRKKLNHFFRKKFFTAIVIYFFVIVRCVANYIAEKSVIFAKFVHNAFKRKYAIKGTALASAIVIVLLSVTVVGFMVKENTEKVCSLEAQCEYTYYEVQPNDGWDKIANEFKPDYMGIRDDLFTGNKFNYTYYLKMANPEVTMLHPHMIIRCPVFRDIYK